CGFRLDVRRVGGIENVHLARVLISPDAEDLAEAQIDLIQTFVVVASWRREVEHVGGRRHVRDDECPWGARSLAVRRIPRGAADAPPGWQRGTRIALERGVDLHL